MRIMIIEDDPKIRQELSEFLNRYGYDPVFPDSFKHITTSILANPPDLILLDINLPVYDGYYICREIRKQSDVPIIIVTSRDSEFDELMSMNLGADDYITKPYNTQILLARIASVLKRANPSSGSTTMSHNGLTLDLSRSVIQSARGETELTKNEVGILRLLPRGHHECPLAVRCICGRQYPHRQYQPPAPQNQRNRPEGLPRHQTWPGLYGVTHAVSGLRKR